MDQVPTSSSDSNIFFSIEYNGKPVIVRVGTQAAQILSPEEWELCLSGKAYLVDQNGFEIGLNGALGKGQKLFLHKE